MTQLTKTIVKTKLRFFHGANKKWNTIANFGYLLEMEYNYTHECW